MKKILLTYIGLGIIFANTTFKIGSISGSVNDGYTIQIQYMSDEPVAGYQFDFLSDGALNITGATDDTNSFDGLTFGNNVLVAFSMSAASAPATADYLPLLTLTASVNNGFDQTEVKLDAKNDCPNNSNCPSRLVVSDVNGSALSSNFHEALWTVGSDSFVLDNDSVSPITYSLSNNYPNPFNPSTVIEFSIAEPSFVNLAIYDASGRIVRTLVSESKVADSYSLIWDGTNDSGVQVSAGMYLYKINAGSFTETKKMLLVK
jgi:hypothetical protein